MQDRVPVNPGRVLVTPENGNAPYYATLTRADNPTQEGTPLNKASLLKDATAALFGLGTNAVPDDALNAIKTLINGANANADTKAKVATGSYTGTGTYGASNPNSLTFDFEPKVVVITPPVNKSSVAGYSFIAICGQTRAVCIVGDSGLNVNYYGEQLTWNEKTFSWYNKSNAQYQCNESGFVYPYLALG